MTGYRLVVRTLDFHSKNVGSNPASPKMENIVLNNVYFYNKKKLTYGFIITTSYISLINPFFFDHYSYENYKNLCSSKPNDKIYLKQSYMILTWFYYLNFITKNKTPNFGKKVTILTLSTKKKKFTITKAPIAHKTNSKEQIQVTFFYYKIIYQNLIKVYFKDYNYFKTKNELLLFFLISKNTFSLSETNILFIKNAKAQIVFTDLTFFKYL